MILSKASLAWFSLVTDGYFHCDTPGPPF